MKLWNPVGYRSGQVPVHPERFVAKRLSCGVVGRGVIDVMSRESSSVFGVG